MSELSSGIYTIYCKKNNKYYVGQSVNVKSRLKQHLLELKKNKHANKDLQHDFNTYGEESFIFEKIKDSEEQFLNMFENYFIEYYKESGKVYNKMPVNDLIRNKEKRAIEIKKENEHDILKNIEFIDMPIKAVDVHVMELMSELTAYYEYDEELSSYIIDCLGEIYEFLNNTVFKYYFRGIMDKIELEVRRKFNNIQIKDVTFSEKMDWKELVEDKKFPVDIYYNLNDKFKIKTLYIRCQ